MGRSRAELVGKSFAEIIPRGDECLPLLTRVYQTGEALTHVQEDDSKADPAVWLYAMWPALDAVREHLRRWRAHGFEAGWMMAGGSDAITVGA